jgi:hypothetical protein
MKNEAIEMKFAPFDSSRNFGSNGAKNDIKM